MLGSQFAGDHTKSMSVFFYGAFMDESIRERHGWQPRPASVAALQGFELLIDPLSRLERRQGATAYGLVCSATQGELDHLYSERWMDQYHPEPVTVQLRAGGHRRALVYVPAGPIAEAEAPTGYVQTLLEIARRLEFPGWYCSRIESYSARALRRK